MVYFLAVNIYQEKALLVSIGDVGLNKTLATLSRISPSSRGEAHVNRSLKCNVKGTKLEDKYLHGYLEEPKPPHKGRSGRPSQEERHLVLVLEAGQEQRIVRAKGQRSEGRESQHAVLEGPT